MKILLLTGLAGLAGTLLRYACIRLISSLGAEFPWGTLSVNIIGAFIAGFCFILCQHKFQAYEAYFPILFIGFLGAFTTFSTFALESVKFFIAEQYGKFICNILLQNLTGILAAISGVYSAKIFFK